MVEEKGGGRLVGEDKSTSTGGRRNKVYCLYIDTHTNTIHGAAKKSQERWTERRKK